MEYISEDEFLEFKKEFEERVRVLGSKHAQIEAFFRDEIHSLRENVSRKEPQICDLSDKINTIAEGHFNLLQGCDDRIRELNSLFSKQNADIQRLKISAQLSEREVPKINLYLNEIEEVKAFLKVISNKTDSLSLSLVDQSKKSEIKDKENESMRKKAFDDISCLDNSIRIIVRSYSDLQKFAYENKKSLDELDSKFKANVNHSLEEYQRINKKIEDAKEFLTSFILDELQEIVIPDVSHFIREDELTQIKHDVHLSSLDAKNSMIKCANIEMQQTINAKKLENLQLKVDRLELSKQ